MSKADFLIARIIHLQVHIFHVVASIESDSDSEALHDLRIALREVRSLLRPLRDHPGLARLDQAAAALLKRTSALRDAQVLAEELKRRGWQTEADRRRQQVAKACHRCTRGRVARRVYAELERWPTELRLVEADAGLGKLKKRARRYVKRDLVKLRKALETQGNYASDWHAIRMRIKRVRYLCENYADWLTANRKSLEELEHAQTALGREHDLSLWCSGVGKDPSLQPLLTTWLVNRVDAQRDVRMAAARLLKRLNDRKRRSTHVTALSPISG
ncbi:CHAD domain-containing protein [Pseudomonas nitroreducens]|uniref:CHAD domain-containing protein n=1 Tax=Pseudomonas nitroreducens TaxID=46680 RepID=UPI003D2E2BBA